MSFSATPIRADAHSASFTRFALLSMFMLTVCGRGNSFYVATNGTPAGPGTMDHPFDLNTALSGRVGGPGTTFWLRGGDYQIGHIDTRIAGAPGKPITFRQLPGENARVDGSLTFFDSDGYLVLRDFELYSSDTNRLSGQMGMGFNPTDINPVIGIACYSPNFSFINLVVHDQTRSGIYVSETSTNTLIYGCVVYNNGWASSDNAEGHSIYVQSQTGTRQIADNLAFNAAGANYHVYENRVGGRLTGVTLDGNVAFNAGALQAVRAYRDWIIGVDAPALDADGIVLKNNMGYCSSDFPAPQDVQIGREGINGGVALLDNYFPQGLSMNDWAIAAVSGNVFGAQDTNSVVHLNQILTPLAAAWDRNTYFRPDGAGAFLNNATEYSFSDWQDLTGYDLNSSFLVGRPSGTKIFVRPNQYEPGRANIIVYNWSDLDTVPVDVSSVLDEGATYEVRNAEDYFAAPVLSGVFDGKPLYLPMTNLTVAVPNGPLLTPPPTGPAFNVFVLLPRLVRLETSRVNGQMQFSWPTNAGYWVLQSAGNLSTNADWTDATNSPAVVDGQFVESLPQAAKSQFFRLRAVPSN